MDRKEFVAAAGSVTAVASVSQASVWFMRGHTLFYPRRPRGLFQRSGNKFCWGLDSNHEASRRSFRSADCDRQAQTRAAARLRLSRRRRL
jgi:hypothetical protein